MTVSEYLDSVGCKRGDDRSFMISGYTTDMYVSRRYLEGGWQEILDSNVISTGVEDTIYGSALVIRIEH